VEIRNTIVADDKEIVFLALDFDGVLHHRDIDIRRADTFPGRIGIEIAKTIQGRFPSVVEDPRMDASGTLFDREHHLRRVLAHCGNVRVIISSSWRYSLTDVQLLQVLSPAVAARVVGVLTRDERDGTELGDRGRRVEGWLREHGLVEAPWMALDDDACHYASHQRRLVQTSYRGLDRQKSAQAVALIRTLVRRLPASVRHASGPVPTRDTGHVWQTAAPFTPQLRFNAAPPSMNSAVGG
jgi:hypothetical protein